jgi:hypothetical protein
VGDIFKGDRVRVIDEERGGFPRHTLADVFWVGMGRGGLRVGLVRDGDRRFMGARRVQKVDRTTGASDATEGMAVTIFRLSRDLFDSCTQHTLEDGSITVTLRTRVRDEAHADRIDPFPAAVHDLFPAARMQFTTDEQTGERVHHYNVLASRERS